LASRKVISGESDGASAVAHELDTVADLVTEGAKLLSIKNAGNEVWSVDKDGISDGGFVVIAKPSDGGAGIQAALDQVKAAGGGIVQLLEGVYDATARIICTDLNNITLQGVGPKTEIRFDTTVPFAPGYGLSIQPGTGVSNKGVDPITAGDTTVVMSNPLDAGPIKEGFTIYFRGDDPEGHEEFEAHEVASDGNDITGEVELVSPIRRSMTNTVIWLGFRNQSGLTIRNLKFQHAAGANAISLLVITGFKNSLIENVIFEDVPYGSQRGLILDRAWNSVVRNCRFSRTDGSNMSGGNWDKVLVENCVFEDAGNYHLHLPSNLANVTIRGNTVRGRGTHGGMDFCNGYACRRLTIDNNIVQGTNGRAIFISGGVDRHASEVVVSNNYITGHIGDSPFYLSGIRNTAVTNNIVKDCGNGTAIFVVGAEKTTILSNVVEDCNGYGILVFSNSVDTIISKNRIRNVNGRGIQLSEMTGCIISDNYVTGATQWGIYVNDTHNCTITGNVCLNNTLEGIELQTDCTNNVVSFNNCNGDGIEEGTGPNVFIGNIP
jgi:parallel beta-helix repeat protein